VMSEQLSELRLDAVYRNTNNWQNPADQFNRFFRFSDGRGINNTSGFRPKSRKGGPTASTECAFCVLVSNFGEIEWPDQLDSESGIFTYYGDNRRPGNAISDTAVGGNRLLERVFGHLHAGDRVSICPFLCFESFAGADGMCMRFIGLAVPGAEGFSSLEDLVAVWRRSGRQRFQNYRATFTILDEASVSHAWLDGLVLGISPIESPGCPPTLARWIRTGRFEPLKAQHKLHPRSKVDQLPTNAREEAVLREVLTELNDRQFEFAAAALIRLMDSRFASIEVTPAVRDGGRDVLADYRVGHQGHAIALNACIEAKRWHHTTSVGVKPVMRLISRLKHRDFGIFVTTSFFDAQVQRELIEDRHPVILVAGGDVARILISREIEGESLVRWIDQVRSSTLA
jgi:hypothetical protein